MKNYTSHVFALIAVVTLLFSFNSANAQNSGRRLGVGLNVGAATNSAYDYAIGGDLRYQFNVDNQLSIPITTGFTNIHGSTDIGNTTVKYNHNYIPLKGGVKYFFNTTGTGLYGLAEIGAAFGVNKGSGTSFVYSPAVGYSFPSNWDLGLKYEGLSRDGGNNGYVGVRLAYGFGL